tara:strand:+ start:699 stop:1604 length:906 start_codon:yes stop_codon:yes gene_type:complete
MQTPPIPENSKKTIININGEICRPEDAKISVFDRGFLFGDSVYEVAKTYQGIPFLLQDHLDRLWKSASRLEMHLTISQDDVSAEVNKALAELGVEEAYFRIILTRGEGPISLDPGEGVKNNLIIIAQEHLPYPSTWYENGVHVVITNVVRVSKESVDPNVKSGNYLNNVMAFMQAKREKAFDSIMLNYKGYVTQGTTSNVWIVKDNTIKTPPLQAGILEGITRKTLLQLAKSDDSLKIEQVNFTAEELINADECFLTSTMKEIVPVTQVDNSPIGTGTVGPLTVKLHSLYSDFVKRTIEGL